MRLRYEALELAGPPPSLELAIALLMERGCLGAEELAEDRIRAYFPAEAVLAPILRELELGGVTALELPSVEQRDWLAEWKASFRGFALGEGFFVLPTWKRRPSLERSILVLDPEQAFGTGTHDTTRLAASLLERHLEPGESVLDLGAGTGLLAMIAARLGARPVTALEIDPEAADCARENLARNDLAEAVRVETADVHDRETLAAGLVVANITAPVLDRLLPRIEARLAILSGLLVEEVDAFAAALPRRFRKLELWTAGEWAALALDAADAS